MVSEMIGDRVKKGRCVFSILSLSIMLYEGILYCVLMVDNESTKSIFKDDFVRIVVTASDGIGLLLEATVLDKNITGFVLLQVDISSNPQYYPKELLEKMSSTGMSGQQAGEILRNTLINVIIN